MGYTEDQGAKESRGEEVGQGGDREGGPPGLREEKEQGTWWGLGICAPILSPWKRKALPVPVYADALHPGGSRGRVASSPPRCLVTCFATVPCALPRNSLCLGYRQLSPRRF